MTLLIHGSIPNKKDRLRPRVGRGKGMMYDAGDRAALNGIVLQLRAQWRAKAPLVHPEIQFLLLVRNARGDRDGKVATLLDALVQARVIEGDNIKRCNGRLVILPAEEAAIEGAEIQVTEAAQFVAEFNRGRK